MIINTDVNGASNVIRKASPNAFMVDGIEGIGLCPVCRNLGDFSVRPLNDDIIQKETNHSVRFQ